MESLTLSIETQNFLYTPVIADGIELETCRAGSPGKLSFQVVKDSVISFHEGDRVFFSVGEDKLFSGFVFTKRRQSDGVINVTAYDQMRYLKNRDTYSYEGLTATELVRQVAADTGLKCGALTNTRYAIPSRIESEKTLFDILQTALDLTAGQTGNIYVLYDEAGELRLSHVSDLALDTLIYAGSIGDFDYTSSIDQASYSAVRLHRAEGSEGETVFYTARQEQLIQRWGLLQYYAKLDEDVDGPTAAQSLLDLYGKRTRKLRITNAVGEVSVRGGSLVPVELDLGDIVVSEFLMAERAVHKFSENGHFMNLTLVGGEFVE